MYQAGFAILMAALASFATLIGAVVAIAFSKQMKPITFAAALACAAGCTLLVAFGDIYREGQDAWHHALKASEDDDERVSSSGLLIVLAGWLVATAFDTFLHLGLNCCERTYTDKSHQNHHSHLGLCTLDMPITSECVHEMHVTPFHHASTPTTSNIWSKMRHSKVLKIFTSSHGLSPEDEMRINQQFMSDTQYISRLGYFTATVLAFHNIPEGIALYGTATSDAKSGVGLAIAISLHNLPQGMAIAVPIYIGSNSHVKPLLFALSAGLAQPLGALIGFGLVGTEPSPAVMSIMLLLTCGILMNASIKGLYASAIRYDEAGEVCAPCLFLGMLVMAVTLVFLAYL